jgi:hypothetical protein
MIPPGPRVIPNSALAFKVPENVVAVIHPVRAQYTTDKGLAGSVDGASHDLTLVDVAPSDNAPPLHNAGASHGQDHTVEYNHDGTITITTTELLQPVATPNEIAGVVGALPSGSMLAYVPGNPRLVPGCRINKILEQYDQFAIESVEYEYVPAASVLKEGQLLMGYVPDPTDEVFMSTGFQSLRDLYARPGSAIFQVSQRGRASFNKPILNWLYTRTDLGPGFDVPGGVYLATMLPFSGTAGLESLSPLGTLTMKYKVHVRSPSIDVLHGNVPFNEVGSISFDGVAPLAQTVVAVPSTQFMTPGSTFGIVGTVGWCSIARTVDGIIAPSTWRVWRNNNGEVCSNTPGSPLWFRCRRKPGDVAVLEFIFFSSLGAAMMGSDPFQWSINAAAEVQGFKVFNANGALLYND